ncbi:DMT family transporter [Rhizobium tumorigenes]|nr:DMT family transporter [Rhizobium tumorigenes]WFS03381.1 DMT family transporter [Rhizobium tumorigenes]
MQLLAAALLFSTAGLFMGVAHASVWTIIFWRSLFALLFTLMIMVSHNGHARSKLDRAGCIAAILSASAMLAFIPAIRMTSVANVAVIHGSLPLMTSLLTRWVGKDRLSPGTLGLGGLAGFGAAVIFSGSASSGSHLAGDCLALLMTCLMALMTIAFHHSRTSIYLLVAVSNAIAAIAGGMLSPSLSISFQEGVVLACFALVQMTLGLIFFAAGSRASSPAEAALISLAEVPLSALWVFLAFARTPAPETLAGAGIILTAVLIHLLTRPGDRNNKERPDAA